MHELLPADRDGSVNGVSRKVIATTLGFLFSGARRALSRGAAAERTNDKALRALIVAVLRMPGRARPSTEAS